MKRPLMVLACLTLLSAQVGANPKKTIADVLPIKEHQPGFTYSQISSFSNQSLAIEPTSGSQISDLRKGTDIHTITLLENDEAQPTFELTTLFYYNQKQSFLEHSQEVRTETVNFEKDDLNRNAPLHMFIHEPLILDFLHKSLKNKKLKENKEIKIRSDELLGILTAVTEKDATLSNLRFVLLEDNPSRCRFELRYRLAFEIEKSQRAKSTSNDARFTVSYDKENGLFDLIETQATMQFEAGMADAEISGSMQIQSRTVKSVGVDAAEQEAQSKDQTSAQALIQHFSEYAGFADYMPEEATDSYQFLGEEKYGAFKKRWRKTFDSQAMETASGELLAYLLTQPDYVDALAWFKRPEIIALLKCSQSVEELGDDPQFRAWLEELPNDPGVLKKRMTPILTLLIVSGAFEEHIAKVEIAGLAPGYLIAEIDPSRKGLLANGAKMVRRHVADNSESIRQGTVFILLHRLKDLSLEELESLANTVVGEQGQKYWSLFRAYRMAAVNHSKTSLGIELKEE